MDNRAKIICSYSRLLSISKEKQWCCVDRKSLEETVELLKQPFRKHGHRIWGETTFYNGEKRTCITCSVCKNIISVASEYNTITTHEYCSRCGAELEGDKNA